MFEKKSEGNVLLHGSGSYTGPIQGVQNVKGQAAFTESEMGLNSSPWYFYYFFTITDDSQWGQPEVVSEKIYG